MMYAAARWCTTAIAPHNPGIPTPAPAGSDKPGCEPDCAEEQR